MIPQTTLTDQELVDKVQEWVSKLCKTGGQAWSLRVPVDVNHDPDVLISELCRRFTEKTPNLDWQTSEEPRILRTLIEIVKKDYPEFEEEHTTGWDLLRNAEIWLMDLVGTPARFGGEIPSFLESHTQGLENKGEDLLSYVEIHAQGLDMVEQIKAFPFDMPSFQFGAEWARDEVIRRLAAKEDTPQ